MTDVRTLGAVEQLPEYLTSAARIANMDKDIRDAAGKARSRIEAQYRAKGYPERQYTIDPDSWELGAVGRNVIVTAKVVRE